MLTQVEDANASTTSNPHPPPSKATSCCQVLTPVAVQKAVYAVCLIWRLLLPIPIPFITDFCTYIYLHYVYNIYIIYIYIIYIYTVYTKWKPVLHCTRPSVFRWSMHWNSPRKHHHDTDAEGHSFISKSILAQLERTPRQFQVQCYMIWSQYMDMIQVYTSI